MKKLAVPLLLSLLFVAIILFQSSRPAPDGDDPPPIQEIDPQAPPVVRNIWVQMLQQPAPNGANMKIKVEYEPGYRLPSTLTINTGTDATMQIVLRDDGTEADAQAGDGMFTGFLTENINDFMTETRQIVDEVNANGGFTTFTGHAGEAHPGQVTFNADAFLAGEWILWAWPFWRSCGDWVKRENSLLITDLGVVENPARTYNIVTGTGNPNGAWTFGTLMRNMVNTGTTGLDGKLFLKNWIKSWMNNVTVRNGQVVAPRDQWRVVAQLVAPWLEKCGVPNTNMMIPSNWESATYWDNPLVTADKLYRYAPFKLTAIINRVDLRQNAGYSSSSSTKRSFNAGETRFIFTLITTAGMPAQHTTQGFGTNPLLDWEGMNVIFEYGNVQPNLCELRNFAIRWQNLSNLPLGSNAYNAALEQITNTVTLPNAAPLKRNGSAINQVRTNERVFAYVQGHPGWNWSRSFWELRQFELTLTGQLGLAPVNNTPLLDANVPVNLVNTLGAPTPNSLNLLDWINTPGIKINVFNGNHKMTDPMIAGSAMVDYQYTHYQDVPWDQTTPNYSPALTAGGNAYEKQMRQQLSLNTCQGCHTGETKTMFMHVLPRGYGQTARYWITPPDVRNDEVDIRFQVNSGTTFGDSNYKLPGGPRDRVIVSAFLTGRDYTNTAYDDDDPTDLNDNNMNGLYYVNDPSNLEGGGAYSYGTDHLQPLKRWGYNDLLRRHQDLCRLINNNCRFGFFSVAEAVSFQPFALGAH